MSKKEFLIENLFEPPKTKPIVVVIPDPALVAEHERQTRNNDWFTFQQMRTNRREGHGWKPLAGQEYRRAWRRAWQRRPSE